MAGRVSLPNSLTGSTLSPSVEGVAINGNRTPPSSGISGTIIPPIIAQPPISAPLMGQPATMPPQILTESHVPSESEFAPVEIKKDKPGYSFNPLNIIWLILIFIAVFLILYTTKVNMVTDLVNGERLLNSRKLIFWSVLISLLIGVLGYVIMAFWKRRKV